jgi:hypothetical protein
MKILHRYTSACLWESPHETLEETVVAAVKSGANLSDANLRGANLRGANLSDANLRGANLSDANLSDAIVYGCALGVPTFDEYLSEVVPALLTAGGVTIQAILDAGAWECHSWDNCPMAVAFKVPGLDKIPPLHRPRAAQFVSLFDARLIPRSAIEAAIAKQGEGTR